MKKTEWWGWEQEVKSEQHFRRKNQNNFNIHVNVRELKKTST